MKRLFAAAAVLTAALIVPTAALAGNHGGGGNGQPKVTICHKAEGKKPVTITIAISALPAHLLLHGDTLGKCPKPPKPDPCEIQTYSKKHKGKCDEEPNPEEPPARIAQINRTGYCFQSSNYGWTFIDLDSTFSPVVGASWFDLYLAKATVELDGKQVTFAGWEDWRTDGGIVLAPYVEGVGLTCDNPYVK